MKTEQFVKKWFKYFDDKQLVKKEDLVKVVITMCLEREQQTRKDTLKEVYNYLKEDMRLSHSAYLDTELRLSVFIKDVRAWFKKEMKK
jgi:hypothetical protein